MARGFFGWSVILGSGFLVLGALSASVVSMVTRVVPPSYPWGSGSGATLELAYLGALHVIARLPVALVAGPLLASCVRHTARPAVLAIVCVTIPLAGEAGSAAWALAPHLSPWPEEICNPLNSTGWLRVLASSGATAMLTGLATALWTTWCMQREQEHSHAARDGGDAGPEAWWNARFAPVVPPQAGRWIATAYGIALVLAALVVLGQRALLPEWAVPAASDVILVDDSWQVVRPHPGIVALGLAAHVVAGAWLIRWGMRRGRAGPRRPSADAG